MAVREGRWDCTTCSTKGTLGRLKVCPSCGTPRPENVKFYLPDDAAVVTDESLLQLAAQGADWICDYCEASNSAEKTVCRQCAAERDSNRSQAVKEYAVGAVPRSGDVKDDPASPEPAHPRTTSTPAAKTANRAGCSRLILPALSLGLFVIALIVFFSWPRHLQMTVAERRWERSVVVEELKTFTEEGWSVPAGGRQLSQRQAVHHHTRTVDHYETRSREVTEQVQVGTEEYVSGQRDKGNGFFEDIISTRPVYETRTRTETYEEPVYRQDPVFQTKYSYEIDRWTAIRTEQKKETDSEPVWPQPPLEDRQRAGRRDEQYAVTLRAENGKDHIYQTSLEQWKQMPIGTDCRVRMVMGKIREVEPLGLSGPD